MMPLNTERSSTRGTLCDSGKKGSIRRICASDKSIRSLMPASLMIPVNQNAERAANGNKPEAPVQSAKRRLAMGAAISLRADFDAESLRRLACRSRHAAQARRLLALALIYDGG